MSYRGRELARKNRRRHQGDNWLAAMWFMLGIFSVAAAFAISNLVAAWDIIEAEQASALCDEMVSIYQQTDGEFGWPNCNHL